MTDWVQQKANQTGAESTSMSITADAPFTPGNLIIVLAIHGIDTITSPPAGFTQDFLDIARGGDYALRVAYSRIAQAGDSQTVTIGFSASDDGGMALFEHAGLSGFDVGAGASNQRANTSTQTTGTTPATAQADSVALAFMSGWGGNIANNWNNGFDGDEVDLWQSPQGGLNFLVSSKTIAVQAAVESTLSASVSQWLNCAVVVYPISGAPPVADKMSVYDGASFVAGVTKVWDGGAWIPSVPKVFDGGSWVPA